MIVAFEGIDASGKSTQIELLAGRLGAAKMKFPAYRTPVGQLIQRMLFGQLNIRDQKGNYTGPISKIDEATILQSLMITNRLEMLPSIYEHVTEGPLIFDRYCMSAIAYGAVDGLDEQWLFDLHAILPQPDYYVLLDLPAEESFRRRPTRQDVYEADRGRITAVAAKYREIWDRMSKRSAEDEYEGTEWIVVNADQPADAVSNQIYHAVITKNL